MLIWKSSHPSTASLLVFFSSHWYSNLYSHPFGCWGEAERVNRQTQSRIAIVTSFFISRPPTRGYSRELEVRKGLGPRCVHTTSIHHRRDTTYSCAGPNCHPRQQYFEITDCDFKLVSVRLTIRKRKNFAELTPVKGSRLLLQGQISIE